MPEPGYNDGNAPPLWVWLVAAVLLIGILLLLQSC